MDSFLEIPTWKESIQVFGLTNLVVTTRPGYSLEKVEWFLKCPAFRGLDFRESEEGLVLGCRSVKAGNSPYSIFFLETSPVPISSTEIRDRVKSGKSISGLLPQDIEDYIIGSGIYGNYKLIE